MSRVGKTCAGIVVLGVLAGAIVGGRRIAVERANKSVELVVEWDDVRSLIAAAGRDPRASTPAAFLRYLRTTHGVAGLAVNELTLAELRDSGRVFLEREIPRSAVAGETAHPNRESLYLVIPDGRLAAQVVAEVTARRGMGELVRLDSRAREPVVLRLNGSFDLLKSLGVGFPPEALRAAAEAGMDVIGRVGTYPGLTKEAVDTIFAQMERQGIRNVIFTGTEIMGNRRLLPIVAEALLRHRIRFGFLEFGKQAGDVGLARLMRGQIVRVHSITEAEMAQLSPAEAVERFVKAARERNVRLLYVRFFTRATEDLIGENSRYLSAIARNLRRVGLVAGRAHPFSALYAGRPLLVLCAAGVIAGGVLILSLVFGISSRVQAFLLVAGVVGSAFLLAFEPTLTLGRKGLALISAFVFPTLAFLWYGSPAPAVTGQVEKPPSPWRALKPLLAMSATTLAGAFLIVGLLGDTRFLLKYDQFAGIKLAHLLPILALGAFVSADVFAPASDWKARREHASSRLRAVLSEPIRVWQFLAVVVALLFLLFLLLRTGNEPGVGVSSLELKIRSLMDRLLFVRPRTKEFLIGHPAMVVALWAAFAGWRPVWVAALLLGAIGQVSLLNTFCHIHTPLLLSLHRSVNGLVLGSAVGLLVAAGMRRFNAVAFRSTPVQNRECGHSGEEGRST